MSKSSFTPHDMQALPGETKQAVMDALWTAYVADGRPSQAEVEAFQIQVALLPWGVTTEQLKGMMAVADAKLTATLTIRNQDTVKAYIERIADRIPTSGVREKTLGTIHRLVPEEKLAESTTLAAFQEALDINTRRAEEIAAEAKAAR